MSTPIYKNTLKMKTITLSNGAIFNCANDAEVSAIVEYAKSYGYTVKSTDESKKEESIEEVKTTTKKTK